MPFNTSTQIFLPSKPENISIVLWNFLLGRQTGWLFTLLHAACLLGVKQWVMRVANASPSIIHTLTFISPLFTSNYASSEIIFVIFHGGRFPVRPPIRRLITRLPSSMRLGANEKCTKKIPFPQKPKHTRPKVPTTKLAQLPGPQRFSLANYLNSFGKFLPAPPPKGSCSSKLSTSVFQVACRLNK